jgi:ferredoxin--NADP+ reductase
MNKIIEKQFLSENIVKIVVEAPLIAKSRKAGHFVIIKLGEKGERVPLTIADADEKQGTITLVVQIVGVSSHKLSKLNKGDNIPDISGPLGQATHIFEAGNVLCAGGGVGIAPLLPIARAFKKAGNTVYTVLAARSKDLIILEDEMRATSDHITVMTDDGSYGNKGLVTNGMEDFLKNNNIDLSIVIGPAIMMKFAAETTKKYNVPTMASLNTIMVDGTGMCGSCRITVDGETKFVCVDGPEFDAHKIDYDELLNRLSAYKDQEMEAYDRHKKHGHKSCCG